MFSTYDFERIFNGLENAGAPSIEEPTFIIKKEKSGPNEVNVFAAIMENGDPWINKSARGKKQTSKKIIISNSLLAESKNDEFVNDVFACLVKCNYPIYYFQGDDLVLSKIPPILTTIELWKEENLKKIISARKNDVLTSGALERKKTDDIVVLDYPEFQKFLGLCQQIKNEKGNHSNLEYAPERLTLSNLALLASDKDRLMKSIDVTTITIFEVDSINLNDIDKVLETFPKLQKIVINQIFSVDYAWQLIKKLKNKGLEIELDFANIQEILLYKITIYANYFTGITIKNAQQLGVLNIIGKSKELRNVTLIHCNSLNEFKITSPLKELTIEKCNKIFIPTFKKISPHLKKLKISNTSSGIFFKNMTFQSLEVLEISNCLQVRDLSFLERCHNLKEIKINTSDEAFIVVTNESKLRPESYYPTCYILQIGNNNQKSLYYQDKAKNISLTEIANTNTDLNFICNQISMDYNINFSTLRDKFRYSYIIDAELLELISDRIRPHDPYINVPLGTNSKALKKIKLELRHIKSKGHPIQSHHVKQLSLARCKFDDIDLTTFSELHTLEIEKVESIDNEQLNKLLANCKSLKKLIIKNAKDLQLNLNKSIEYLKIVNSTIIFLSPSDSIRTVVMEDCSLPNKFSFLIFPNLETLHLIDIKDFALPTPVIDLSDLKKLSYIKFHRVELMKLTLGKAITYFDISGGDIKNLTFDSCTVLKGNLDGKYENIQSVGLISIKALQTTSDLFFKFPENSLSSSSIEKLHLIQNENIPFPPLNFFPSLQELELKGDSNYKTTLDISQLYFLKKLTLHDFNLGEVNFPEKSQIEELYFDSVNFDSVKIENLSFLRKLPLRIVSLLSVTFHSIDLSNLINLEEATITTKKDVGLNVDLLGCQRLKKLHIGTPSLKGIQHLENCSNLTTLSVTCSNQELKDMMPAIKVPKSCSNRKLTDSNPLKELKKQSTPSRQINLNYYEPDENLIDDTRSEASIEDKEWEDEEWEVDHEETQDNEESGAHTVEYAVSVSSGLPSNPSHQSQTNTGKQEIDERTSSGIGGNTQSGGSRQGHPEQFNSAQEEQKPTNESIHQEKAQHTALLSKGDMTDHRQFRIPKFFDSSLLGRFSSDFKVSLYSHTDVPINYNRFTIFDRLDYKHNKISLSSSYEILEQIDPKKLTIKKIDRGEFSDEFSKIKTEAEKTNSNKTCGLLEATLEKNVLLPLCTNAAASREPFPTILCQNADAMDYFWHPEHQQYYVKLKDDYEDTPLKIKMGYLIHTPSDYYKELADDAKIATQNIDKLIPENLKNCLLHELTRIPKLQFLFLSDDTLPLVQKIQRLKEFCTFEKKTTSFLNGIISLFLSDLSALTGIIERQEGVCRHSALCFMVLSRLIGVPTHMIQNEIHAFCEVPLEGDPSVWRQMDLGGGRAFDITPEYLRQDSMPQEEKKDKQPLPAIKNEKIKELYQNRYKKTFDNLIQNEVINSIEPLLEKRVFEPLITLTNNQTAFSVNKEIVKKLKAKNIKHIFINKPSEFKLFLNPPQITEDGQGKRQLVSGPLQEIINNGGVIVVNWAHFNEKEKASFKSILDTQPTILGQTLDKEKVRVIGLMSEKDPACQAFSSRTKPYTLSDEFFTPDAPITNTNEPIEKDLFNSLNWQKILIAQIGLENGNVDFQKKIIFTANDAAKPRPIHILNPPHNDINFDAFVHRVNDEKKILINGKMVDIHPEVNITLGTKTHTQQSEKIAIHTDDKLLQGKKIIYIGIHNIHECCEFLKFIDKNKSEIQKGYFNEYDDDSVFYVTSSIPDNEWEYLIHHLSEKEYETNKFNFVLAPGVSILNHSRPSSDEMKLKTASSSKQEMPEMEEQNITTNESIILSNDPDFWCKKHAKEFSNIKGEPIVFHLTPDMKFTNLFAEMKFHENDDHSIEFSYKEKIILEHLKAGRNVILTGELSADFYQRLLSLVPPHGKPHLYSNGEGLEFPGQLKLVLPNTTKQKECLITYKEVKFTNKEYAAEFTTEKEKKAFARVVYFFWLLNKLPYVEGLGPPSPTMSFKLAKRMVSKLTSPKQRFHLHNPVKGLINYDYLEGSEHYFCSNVIAKLIFCNKDNTATPRRTNLVNIIKKYGDNFLTEHLWEVLNCFRGKDLENILGTDLQNVDFSGSFPTINPQLLESIIQRIKEIIASPSECISHKKSHVDKREEQLKEVITNDPDTFLILVKGGAGVGKSFSIRNIKKHLQLQNIKCYEGSVKFIEWLENPEGGVFLLDEGNLALPGTWDFLKGLSHDKKIIYYEGKEYPLTDKHKIIVTGNPENYPNRHFHPFFQQYGETILFKIPEDDYLEREIVNTILAPQPVQAATEITNTMEEEPYASTGTMKTSTSALMLNVFHLACEINPTYLYSIRDLEDLAQRFVVLKEKNEQKNPNERVEQMELLWQACVGEFAGTFNVKKRQQFLIELDQLLKTQHDICEDQEDTPLIKIHNELYLPREKEHMVHSIEQNLLVREKSLTSTNFKFKCGTLIEGEAGIGKSTLLEAILQKNGFTLEQFDLKKYQDRHYNIQDPQRKYYIISAGDEKLAEYVLKKAFNEGSIVILDELNLDENLEKILNQLLVDNTNKKVNDKFDHTEEERKPGFMVYASQNPGYYAGRESSSKALWNRLGVHLMEDFSHTALMQIANHNHIIHPDLFVETYENAKKTNPNVNMRTFYNAIKDSKEKEHEDNLRIIQSMILKHEYKLHGGGVVMPYKVNPQKDVDFTATVRLSHSSAKIYTLIEDFWKSRNKNYSDLYDQINTILKNKDQETKGSIFFSIGKRDQTTATLYKTILELLAINKTKVEAPRTELLQEV